MLDIKRIRQNPQEILHSLHTRRADFSLDDLLAMDEQRRELLAAVEEKKALRNTASKQMGLAKKKGASAAEDLMQTMRKLGTEIETLDAQIAQIDQKMDELLCTIPNLPHESVPVGADESANVEVRLWGSPRVFLWEPKSHREIGEDLGILSTEQASFRAVYRGMGAQLKRAVINLMLDTHASIGYEEVHFSVSSVPDSMEESVLQLYQERILNASQMPVCHCYLSEGRYKNALDAVKLVKICRPEESYAELEHMTVSAEKVLQLLGLPYRVVCLSTGSMDFSAAKTYAVEVWMPSCRRYVPLSSCSNCEDFLARRMGIRYRTNPKEKPQYVHTLNGRGAVVAQTIDAILENFQNDDGSVTLPEVLVPYMRTEFIK